MSVGQKGPPIGHKHGASSVGQKLSCRIFVLFFSPDYFVRFHSISLAAQKLVVNGAQAEATKKGKELHGM